VLREEIDPWSLFPAIPRLHALDDELGFIALLAGTRVICHDERFYSGWGLTEDRPGVPRRDRTLTLPQLCALHLLHRSGYHNPYTGDPCDFASALEIVRACRQVERANRRIAVCTGMAFWKRERIAQFFHSRAGAPLFIDHAPKAVETARARQGGIAVWASREPPSLAALARTAGVTIHRVEDGFIRSAGLGADFIPPASITVDSLGLYYDPSRPSELERLLEEIALSPADLGRIRDLMRLMVSRNVTKYASVGSVSVQAPPGRRLILVPGQVEDDRSVLLARAGVQGNLDLLQRVRAANPTAYIVYKPHPDVEAGHRPGAIRDEAASRHADRIIREGSMGELIQICDELHCLTSLAGFEALLRNKPVTVYGQPFYAGWGLTTDIAPPPRRQRRLSIEELVAGTLLLYPRYLDPLTGIPCSPEVLIGRLMQPTNWRPSLLVRARRLQGRFCRFLRAQALRLKRSSAAR
jgi:capsular polysaccharide export protein